MRYSIKMCCRWRQRDHEIITTTTYGKKNLQKLIDWGNNLWLTLCEKMLLHFRVASCFPLFLLEYRVILGKEQGKSRKGKNYQIRKRKKTHQIFDISSPPEYELSLLFGPVCRASLKKWKQKRVSRNDKIRNSFRQRRQWNINQRALWACSFMLWLKFVLISWTWWI